MSILERHRDALERIIGLVFPPACWDKEALGAIVPITMQPIFVSPGFKRLFVKEGELFRLPSNIGESSFYRGRLIRAYLFVLEQIYGIRRDFDYPIIRVVTDPETGLDRYFKMELDFRFIEIRPRGE